jgi:hypothetical protein
MLHRLHAAATIRLRELTSPSHRDLGEGPVPYIIMVATITVAALAIGTALVAIANGWLDKVPE